MKRCWMFLFVLLACTLSACSSKAGGEPIVYGRLIEASMDEAGRMVSCVVDLDSGETMAFLLTEQTYVCSFLDGVDAEDFLSGAWPDVQLSVRYDAAGSETIAREGRQIRAHRAILVEVEAYLMPEKASLPDGTQADIWRYSGYTVYVLPDGTKLLQEQDLFGPSGVSGVGLEGLDDLPEAAQQNILAFYQRQGPLYDVQAELEKAYAEYLTADDGAQFEYHFLSQAITPTASSDTVIYFMTSAYLPIDSMQTYEYRIGAAFDKTTGEHIDNFDLFSCPPEQTIQALLEIAKIRDPILKEEMEQAFESGNITLFSDVLEVDFRPGTLPSQEHSYLLGLEYNGKLLEILHEWAVPNRSKAPV